MRIFDEKENEIFEVDYTKGRTLNVRILVAHHEAVEAVKEQGHYETVAEYPNGGKDVKWVVDVAAVEAKEAWDEFEDILRFIPFTTKELAEQRIAELKGNLAATDYKILKVVEGAITLAEIAETIKQRAAWRKEINELEVTSGGEQ